MGLLDEAIREHLELKRRRGADTGEVARQEREALGPPRGGDLEAAPAALHAVGDPPVEHAPVPEVHPLPPVQDEPPRPHGDPAAPLLHEDSQATQAFDAEEIRAAMAPEAASPPAPVAEPEPDLAPEPDPEPEPAPAPRADEDAEDEVEDEGDVLEETPEFLQETPEHDRLWFEQRPPRDFDF